MPNWFWKRWVGAVLAGAVITAGAAMAEPDQPGSLPKPNQSITVKFDGQAERTVTVVKATRKPDGSVETEVKDPKTGETFTIVDPPSDAKPDEKAKPPAAAKAPPGTTKWDAKPPMPAGRDAGLPRAKERAEDPLTPSVGKPMPETPADKAPDRRGMFGKLFGRDKPDTPAATTPAPEPDEGGKRPILNRLFGSKKPAAPAGSNAMPSPAKPTPAPVATQPAPTGTNRPALDATGEPPRAMSAKPPATPAAPGRTDPVVPPTPLSSGPPPAPLPVPPPSGNSIPVPTQMPPPGAVPVPMIPSPPGGSGLQANAGVAPALAVRPVGSTAGIAQIGNTAAAFAQLAADIRPYATALRDAPAPSTRLVAAKVLSQCRHASTDQVKAILFQAAQGDPCPEVRAACIDHLATLGYYHPAFVQYLKASCTNSADDVQTAAKVALARMTPYGQ